MTALSLGYSPCPNDTFIFYAMVHGRIDTSTVRFNEVLLDVETLNRRALQGELDVTKVSFHAIGHLREKYCLLRSGAALGRGCGPLVISKNEYTMDDLHSKKIAIPGKLTTAYLLLQLYDPRFSGQRSAVSSQQQIIEMPFHEIMGSVADGAVDAGLIIHEGRFTYPSYGLLEVIDLGAWWEKETGLPIPLGGILAKRSLGNDLIRDIDTVICRSVAYAFENRSEPADYIKQHAQELSDDVINQHINLYVNDYSVDVGDEGEEAVKELLLRAEGAGIIPESNRHVFLHNLL